VALPRRGGISPSAEGDQRSERWIGGRFLKESKQTRKRDLREFASQTIATQKLLSIF